MTQTEYILNQLADNKARYLEGMITEAEMQANDGDLRIELMGCDS